MNKNSLELLKKELSDIKKECIINISKNLFVLSFFSALSPLASKSIGLGYPFVIDTNEAYRVSINQLNDNKKKKIKTKIVYRDELKEYEDFTKELLVFNNYKYDNTYTRDVYVYELDSSIDDYQDVIINYKDYMIEDNMIDTYQENTYDINEQEKVNVIYCDIERDHEYDESESIILNIFSSIGYSAFLINVLYICGGNIYFYVKDSYDKSDDIKRKIKKLK